ncbi:hypothetical protein [uncultured Photobacterium sp.]|uniref:hypothetical protein n=1 Tax=uncultured Photobacterium sp. TaxID=173973 RepID=UPI00261F3364|nr:hypothetical protein [uncultured Photobacterium sp.]
MVSDLLSVSIHHFQSDCLQLCEHHYPTVHNRGMREYHMGRALCRRIISTLNQADIPAKLQLCPSEEEHDQTVFAIETPQFIIWLVAHRLDSANLARRDALLQLINTAVKQTASNKQHHLLIVSDHWFDRSKASKEIPAWWLGQLPDNCNEYLADGIRLQACAHTLPQSLKQKYSLTEGLHEVHHPLKRHSNGKVVHRYILLTAYYYLNQPEQ